MRTQFFRPRRLLFLALFVLTLLMSISAFFNCDLVGYLSVLPSRSPAVYAVLPGCNEPPNVGGRALAIVLFACTLLAAFWPVRGPRSPGDDKTPPPEA